MTFNTGFMHLHWLPKNMHRFTFHLLFLLTVFVTIAQATDPYERQDAIDVQHYVFRIELNDTTNRIAGEASITILFKKSTTSFFLDFAEQNAKGNGMVVSEVRVASRSISFKHAGERLTITLPKAASPGEVMTVTVHYTGIPDDGLVIDKNKFGDRTFFADHWPTRGHLWLPCIDHPSDKATVEFMVTAPEVYEVIGSGIRMEETSLPKQRKLTRYAGRIPIPVKVMAIGVARFAVEESGAIDHVPQSIWVFPQDRDAGFHDFAVGRSVFEYFNKNIGPYPFEKLAHVQSRTRWGGLENAGNIFYNQNSVKGKQDIDGLVAHETAHQWFGNSVAENDWHHVWLSEGLSTYFAWLYLEHDKGMSEFRGQMAKSRTDVIAYFHKNPHPIVDTTITDISRVLNTNTYPKAGWVLHMLRRQLGDELFWKGIRDYYQTYRDRNVMTVDFQRVMEKASGQDLEVFFRQWFFRAGHPQLSVTWKSSKGKSGPTVTIKQLQPEPFRFPFTIRINFVDGKWIDQTVNVSKREETFPITASQAPTGITPDPSIDLLFETKLLK
jgi:aminopeptidase N